MIHLSFTVDNINTVLLIYDRLEVEWSAAEGGVYATVSGLTGSRVISEEIKRIRLATDVALYIADDTYASADDVPWYRSRYYSVGIASVSGTASAWSDPVIGSAADLYYSPLYPDEIPYGTTEQLVIDRIRRLIGDPLGLRREYGDEAASSIHPDNKTYEMDEKGWPVSINMGGNQYAETTNPTVNGYRFLKFDTTISGIVSGDTCASDVDVDIWYYTFRHSDRQIMEAYDNCPPPPKLTTTTANSEAYMLQTAVDLLMQEVWEDSGEDGAVVSDEGSRYDPSPGLRMRQDLIDKLQKRLDKTVKSIQLTGISGVRLD